MRTLFIRFMRSLFGRFGCCFCSVGLCTRSASRCSILGGCIFFIVAATWEVVFGEW